MSLIPVVPKFIILEHVFIDVSYDDLRRCYEDTGSLCSSIDEIFEREGTNEIFRENQQLSHSLRENYLLDLYCTGCCETTTGYFKLNEEEHS